MKRVIVVASPRARRFLSSALIEGVLFDLPDDVRGLPLHSDTDDPPPLLWATPSARFETLRGEGPYQVWEVAPPEEGP